MFQINFNDYDHNFCESQLYSTTQHPEYLNALSSLFITFIGINGLIKPKINFLLIILYSSLTVNGITSCGYHYLNSIGWGLLDRFSMILIAISSIYLFVNNIKQILVLKKWRNINLINKCIHLFIIIYFTILLTVCGLHMELLFNILFGIFLSSLIIFVILIDKYSFNLQIPQQIINYGWNGTKYIALSAIFWIGTENLCKHLFFIKYLFGHVFWHIFVSYGGYLISLIPAYMYLQDKNINVDNKTIIIKKDIFKLPYLDYSN